MLSIKACAVICLLLHACGASGMVSTWVHIQLPCFANRTLERAGRKMCTHVSMLRMSVCMCAVCTQELSERTAIRTEDIIQTLTQLGLIQYQKGQHVICAAPQIIQQKLKQVRGHLVQCVLQCGVRLGDAHCVRAVR